MGFYKPIKYPWWTGRKATPQMFFLGSKYASIRYMTYLSKNVHQQEEDCHWTST